MKKLILIAFLLFYIILPEIAYSYEEVRLIPCGMQSLSVPKSNYEMYEKDNNDFHIRKEEKSPYFEEEDEVFDSKAGKIFSKFINDRAINNKLNRMYSEVESKYLDTDY